MILTLQHLAWIADCHRSKHCDNEFVLAHGCFDLLHIGHIKHLRAASMLGSKLFVTVTPDQFINKGAVRPIFTQDLRADAVDALRIVDYVAISEWETAVEVIDLLRPHFFVKGSEYRDKMTPMLSQEKAAVEAHGGQLVFTNEPTWHSTALIAEAIKELNS